MSTMTLEQVRDWHAKESREYFDLDQHNSAARHAAMADAIDAHLRERESARAAVTDGEAFSRGYVWGYAAALGAAASECRRQAGALDHGGNEYIRYADAIKCAAAIGSLRAPELNELSGNSGQLPMLASARPIDAETVLDEYVRICAAEHAEHAMAADRVDAMRRALAHAGAASAQVPDVVTLVHAASGLNASERHAWALGWNDCRDAMLAAAPKRGEG